MTDDTCLIYPLHYNSFSKVANFNIDLYFPFYIPVHRLSESLNLGFSNQVKNKFMSQKYKNIKAEYNKQFMAVNVLCFYKMK